MAQEDHYKRHSSSSSGGGGSSGGDNRKRSKKLKPVKVPQRGLGVAQLEKIRLEEQIKKDALSSLLPPTNLVICRSNPSNYYPLPPPWSLNNDVLDQTSHAPLPKAMDSNGGGGGGGGGGGEIGWLMRGRGGWPPKMLNDESSNEVEEESSGGSVGRSGFAFMKNVLPYESNVPTWPISNVVQQRAQYFQQPSSSSLVNVSIGNSYSAVSASSLDPPSNQSNCGKNIFTPSLWSEEDKMAGMKKRSYPFSLEEEQIPTFHCKLPCSFVSPILRSHESASCSSGGTSNIEPTYPVIREGQSRDPSPEEVVRDNSGCHVNGDFLTLAPSETHSNTKPTLINFFPPPEKTHSREINGNGTEEFIDLNLKL